MKFYFENYCIDSEKYIFLNNNSGIDIEYFRPKKRLLKINFSMILVGNILITELFKEIILCIYFKNSTITFDHGDKLWRIFPYNFSFIGKKNKFEVDFYCEEEENFYVTNYQSDNRLYPNYAIGSKYFEEFSDLCNFKYGRVLEEIGDDYVLKDIYLEFELSKLSDDLLSKGGIFELKDIGWSFGDNLIFEASGSFYLDDNKLIRSECKCYLKNNDELIKIC
jgi:hypothetical protein